MSPPNDYGVGDRAYGRDLMYELDDKHDSYLLDAYNEFHNRFVGTRGKDWDVLTKDEYDALVGFLEWLLRPPPTAVNGLKLMNVFRSSNESG